MGSLVVNGALFSCKFWIIVDAVWLLSERSTISGLPCISTQAAWKSQCLQARDYWFSNSLILSFIVVVDVRYGHEIIGILGGVIGGNSCRDGNARQCIEGGRIVVGTSKY